MPRVKIDYVVSFSSEDPENPANNLLGWELSRRKWLCCKGEPSCSVVLQLNKAVKISAVHIGAHHSALVEVLVGLSEKPNQPFQVLVPSSVLLSPAESRREEGAARVRTFSGAQLSDARLSRWDRLRLVCCQPYNKHCKYGLSFIQIFESDGSDETIPDPPSLAVEPPAASPAPTASPSLPGRLFNIETNSSDDDDFKPGELFAKLQKNKANANNISTESQIRKATSQALRNINDNKAKIVKTPISKANVRHDKTSTNKTNTDHKNRQRDSLMYTDEEERPHHKIDQLVQRRQEEKDKQQPHKQAQTARNKHGREHDVQERDKGQENHKASSEESQTSHKGRHTGHNTIQTSKEKDINIMSEKRKNNDRNSKEQPRNNSKRKKREVGAERVLSEVQFVLSGYENPRRAALRDLALSLGAICLRDYSPLCTHLICAFPNTPKLKLVRSLASGGQVVAVRGEWLEACARAGRRLAWEPYATEPHLQQPMQGDTDDEPRQHSESDSECDTEDEIEKVRQQQKRRRTDDVRSPEAERREGAKNLSSDSDVAFVRDERFRGSVTLASDSDGDVTAEESGPGPEPRPTRELPDIFAGCTFSVDEHVREAGFDPDLLERYVKAYGGELVLPQHMETDTQVQYWLSTRHPAPHTQTSTRHVAPDWLWRCHQLQTKCPVDDYLL